MLDFFNYVVSVLGLIFAGLVCVSVLEKLFYQGASAVALYRLYRPALPFSHKGLHPLQPPDGTIGAGHLTPGTKRRGRKLNTLIIPQTSACRLATC